jgi:hypothetical protein
MASQEETESKGKPKAKYDWLGGISERFTRNYKDTAIKKNLTPDDVQEIIDSSTTDTFEGNPTLRAEKSSILLPLQKIALKVIDGEVGIVKSFLSFQAANTLKKAVDNKATKTVMMKSRQVISAMSRSEVTRVNGALGKLGVPDMIKKFAGSGSAGKFIKSEANFALMSVIGTMIGMGIYDGLDLTTMKDKILEMDPLTGNSTVSQSFLPGLAGGMASRHFYGFFNDKFDIFYDKMMTSKRWGAKLVQALDGKMDLIGKKIFKATRLGIDTGAAGGESLTKKLGLVGVGEGAQFTLKGLMKSLTMGLAFGMVANLVVDGVVVGIKGYSDTAVVGGNRNVPVKLDANSFRFQKNKSKIKDWLNERKFALQGLWEGYKRTPLAKIAGATGGFLGAYGGSVVAGAVLVGGGVPAMIGGVMIASLFGGIGSFLGSWATTKFERGKTFRGFRRRLVENRLLKAIRKMSVYLAGDVTEEEAVVLAKDRSEDFYKLEGMGSNYAKMFLVENFEKVSLYENGDYIYMKAVEQDGEEFDMQAHIRYNLIDLDGNEGRWDIMTNKVYNVGSVQDCSGFDVHFVSDDERFFVEDGVLNTKDKQSHVRVLTNGTIMTLDDNDKEKWVIRGLVVNTDLFLRNAQERFTWDWDMKVFRSINKAGSGKGSLEPVLLVLKESKEEGMPEGAQDLLYSMLEESGSKSRKMIEKINDGNESDFFMKMEENGVSNKVIEKFIGMDQSGWKNILLGKMERGSEERIQSALMPLASLSRVELITELEKEIADSSQQTVWDKVQELISPAAFSASFVK